MIPREKYLKAIVSGSVQGVGYRYFVQDCAERMKLKGFVRNLQNGKVEVHAEGNESALGKFLEMIEAKGGLMHVKKIETEWKEPKKEFSRFEIRRD